MRNVLTMPYRWSSLAAILLAVAFFMPTKELVAQMPPRLRKRLSSPRM